MFCLGQVVTVSWLCSMRRYCRLFDFQRGKVAHASGRSAVFVCLSCQSHLHCTGQVSPRQQPIRLLRSLSAFFCDPLQNPPRPSSDTEPGVPNTHAHTTSTLDICGPGGSVQSVPHSNKHKRPSSPISIMKAQSGEHTEHLRPRRPATDTNHHGGKENVLSREPTTSSFTQGRAPSAGSLPRKPRGPAWQTRLGLPGMLFP